MKVCVLAVLSALVLAAVVGCVEGKDGGLRIGVKKRPETCDMRTKKGDKLSMHYTVSVHYFLSPCPCNLCCYAL